MKIPGLTFIIVPILCWLLYMYSSSIVNTYNENPGKFIAFSCIIYFLAIVVELFGFRLPKHDTDKEIFENTILLLPFTLLYKFLIFLNKHLTITL